MTKQFYSLLKKSTVLLYKNIEIELSCNIIIFNQNVET